MANDTVLFRVDAGKRQGLGHLVRCRALAESFLSRGIESTFEVEDPGLAERVLPAGHGMVVRRMPERGSAAAVAVEERPAWAVLDRLELCAGEQAALRSSARNGLVVINDEGAGPFDCDVLIRPNLLGLERPAALDRASEYRSGAAHVILDPRYSERARQSARREERGRLLVCFGGSDPTGLTLQAADAISRMNPVMESDVVLGAAFPADAARQVEHVLGTRPGRLHRNLPCLIDLWATADVALISGGTLLYEAGFMGVPAIVVAQNAEQAREASILTDLGTCATLGFVLGDRRADILDALRTLAGDSRLRASMITTALRVFERNGVGTIVARLMARSTREGAI